MPVVTQIIDLTRIVPANDVNDIEDPVTNLISSYETDYGFIKVKGTISRDINNNQTGVTFTVTG